MFRGFKLTCTFFRSITQNEFILKQAIRKDSDCEVETLCKMGDKSHAYLLIYHDLIQKDNTDGAFFSCYRAYDRINQREEKYKRWKKEYKMDEKILAKFSCKLSAYDLLDVQHYINTVLSKTIHSVRLPLSIRTDKNLNDIFFMMALYLCYTFAGIRVLCLFDRIDDDPTWTSIRSEFSRSPLLQKDAGHEEITAHLITVKNILYRHRFKNNSICDLMDSADYTDKTEKQYHKILIYDPYYKTKSCYWNTPANKRMLVCYSEDKLKFHTISSKEQSLEISRKQALELSRKMVAFKEDDHPWYESVSYHRTIESDLGDLFKQE